MKPVYFSPEAESDLADVWSYVAQWDEDAADRLIDRIRSLRTRLSDHPLSGRNRDELAAGIRSVLVRPYIVYYRVGDDGVEVIRVFHGARDQAAALSR